MSELPPGFVLDAAPATAAGLPPGFVLDQGAGGQYQEPPISYQPGERPLTVGGRTPPAAQPSAAEAFGRGFGQGATFNFGDEVSGLQAASGLPAPPVWLGPAGTLYNMTRTGAGAARMAAEGVAPGTFGTTAGDQYQRTVEAERAANVTAAEAHPIASAAGQIGGAIPSAVLAPEIGALKTLSPFARAAVTGAGYGALSGAGEGTDLADRANQAGSGAVLGGTLGGVASTAASALKPVASYVGKAVGLTRGTPATVDAEAARRIQAALARDAANGSSGLNVSAMEAAQRAGLPAINADRGGETVKALARSAANTSPEARVALQDAINPRYANQGERINETIRNVSPTPTPGDAGATLEGLQARARAANKPAYARAYAQGANGVWDGDLYQLTQAPDVQAAIKAATRTGANRATVDGFPAVKNPFGEVEGKLNLIQKQDGSVAYPSLQFWDHVQRNLRDMADSAARAGNNSAAADTKALRAQLLARLDAHAPAFAQARRGAAGFFGGEDALEAGQKFVTGNQHINDARRAFAKMSDAERALFREGFVSELTNKIQSLGDSRDVVNSIFSSPKARDKIRLALGDEGAGKLEAHLRVENIMTRLRTAINGNSTSIRQLAELGMAGGMGGVGQSILTGEKDPRNLTVGFVLGALAKKGVVKIDANVARRVGEMLASSDPKIIDRGLTAAAKNPTMMKALQALENWLPAAAGNVAGPRAAPALRAITGNLPSNADENKRP